MLGPKDGQGLPATDTGRVAVGMPAPDFTLVSLAGGRITLSDFREIKLDDDASVLTYTVKGTGKDWPPKGQRHSTVWVKRDGRWLAAFHQGTNIER